jgi:hypothetical protein
MVRVTPGDASALFFLYARAYRKDMDDPSLPVTKSGLGRSGHCAIYKKLHFRRMISQWSSRPACRP